MAEKKKLRITQLRSTIGRRENTRRVLRALGLKKPNQSVVHADTPQIRGMIQKVKFMVEVEEA
ncbi:MAG: 50S ribosomal protein L30 [Fidelibacterota bacterium]